MEITAFRQTLFYQIIYLYVLFTKAQIYHPKFGCLLHLMLDYAENIRCLVDGQSRMVDGADQAWSMVGAAWQLLQGHQSPHCPTLPDVMNIYVNLLLFM